MSMKRFKKWYYIVPLAVVAAPIFIALFILLGGGVVMLLWNWLLPPLFGWPEITLLQGFGLLALCRILFGGFGKGGGGGGRPGHKSYKCTPDDDKKQFRQRMRERFDRRTEATEEPEKAE